MTAATYGACVIALVGSEVIATRADDNVRMSDYVIRTAPGITLDGCVVSIPAQGGGVVDYELTGWDANAEAHVAKKLPARRARRTRA